MPWLAHPEYLFDILISVLQQMLLESSQAEMAKLMITCYEKKRTKKSSEK